MNQKYEIEKRADGTFRAYVYDPVLATRLNRSLRVYPKLVNFVTERSEGIFPFTERDYKHVLAILNS